MSGTEIIGVLGGMGPIATAYFFEKILEITASDTDQGHIKIIIDSNPKIPDRTKAILRGDKSPFPLLKETALNLERANVDFIVIPCVTAHYFLKELQLSINIPILNMIKETVKEIQVNLPRVKKVGLLCTTGTIKTELYQELLGKIKVDVISPDVTEQRSIMDTIYGREGIKAGYLSGKPKGDIIKVAKRLIRRGAEAIIIGCTEISMVIKEKDVTVPIIDSLDILVKAAVKKASQEKNFVSL